MGGFILDFLNFFNFAKPLTRNDSGLILWDDDTVYVVASPVNIECVRRSIVPCIRPVPNRT